jgi:hypothetical protein
LVGAARLAEPGSAWARRRYKPKKLARAQRRWDRIHARRRRVRDALVGAPSANGSAPEVAAAEGPRASAEAPRAAADGPRGDEVQRLS